MQYQESILPNTMEYLNRFSDRYTSKLSRDHPLIWATRFDIPIISLFIIPFLLLILVNLFIFKNHDDYYDLSTSATYCYLTIGVISLLISIYWIFSKLNSLHIGYSPKLRPIPWSITSHVSTAIIFLPSIVISFLVLNEAENYKDFYLRDEIGYILPIILFSLSSFLASMATLSKFFGFQDCLIGIGSSTAILLSLLLTIIFLTESFSYYPLNSIIKSYSGNSSTLLLLFPIYIFFLVILTVLGKSSLKGILRYVLFYPVFFLSTAGFCLSILALYFDSQTYKLASVSIYSSIPLLMFFIYIASAIVIEFILRRIGYNQ